MSPKFSFICQAICVIDRQKYKTYCIYLFTRQKNKKTRDLWWQGLPSSVRGKVWRLAIGNDLNLTKQLYEICLSRAQTRLNNTELNTCGTGTACAAVNQHVGDSTCSDVDQESSLDVIKLDIARTFPNLCIFQEGGPYSSILHSLLAAYVCYRPDVGYVQGMSFIAAILILNMELFDAFICFANLLNRPLHLAAYTLNQRQMQAYYAAYNEIFNYNLPKLFAHFEKSGLTPDLYLLDWVYTVFAKAMPLDVACRVWDVFLRDGDEFIFRTALGKCLIYTLHASYCLGNSRVYNILLMIILNVILKLVIFQITITEIFCNYKTM